MTARYRCCWCGSAVAKEPRTMREHIVKRHRMALELALHPLLTFTTQGEAIAPPRPAKQGPPRGSVEYRELHEGVSGEGDS